MARGKPASAAASDNETDDSLDYDEDGWHWTTGAAHYNPDDIPYH